MQCTLLPPNNFSVFELISHFPQYFLISYFQPLQLSLTTSSVTSSLLLTPHKHYNTAQKETSFFRNPFKRPCTYSPKKLTFPTRFKKKKKVKCKNSKKWHTTNKKEGMKKTQQRAHQLPTSPVFKGLGSKEDREKERGVLSGTSRYEMHEFKIKSLSLHFYWEWIMKIDFILF